MRITWRWDGEASMVIVFLVLSIIMLAIFFGCLIWAAMKDGENGDG